MKPKYANIYLIACIVLAAILVVVVITTASASSRPTLEVRNQGNRVVITNCGSEDGCAIDYRSGDKWVIRQVIP